MIFLKTSTHYEYKFRGNVYTKLLSSGTIIYSTFFIEVPW